MDISDLDRVSPLRTLFRWVSRPTKKSQEGWRRVALRVHVDLPREAGLRTVLMVAAGNVDYGTGCALELAASLAEELGKPILLVDAAPRERQLTTAVKCDGLQGLTDRLLDPEVPLSEIVRRTTHPNVDFLAAGIVAEPVGLFTPERVVPLLEALQRGHEMVILFGGAVPANGLALALAPHVGRVLLMAVENETPTEDLDAAHDLLRIRNSREVGLVLAART